MSEDEAGVATAVDGPARVAVCRDRSPDLVILDLVLPGLDGIEERSRVRSALARLPRKQAAALVLRHIGLSYADVAAALDLFPRPALPEELTRHASSN